MDIATLKEEARALEQQGRTAEALALYRKTLARLEGTPGILRELPLYVKAGDLNLKLGDGKAAIAMYERAAKRYAQYGSSKSVIALCSKILRVAPVKTYVYLSLARMMIERGHVGEAGKVLATYAERVRLGKAQEVVQSLTDLDVDKARPVLEMLLEVAGRAEGAKLKTAELQAASSREDSVETEVGYVADESVELQGREEYAEHDLQRDDGERQGETPESISGYGGESQPDYSMTESESQPGDTEESQEDSSAWPEQRQLIEIPNLVRGAEPLAPAEPVTAEEPVVAGEQEPAEIEQREEQWAEEADVALGYAPAPGSGKHSAVEVPVEDTDSDFSLTIEPPPREEPGDAAHREPVGEEPVSSSPWAPPREKPAARRVIPAESISRTGARPQPPLTFTTDKPKSSKAVWLWVALGVIVIGGGGGLILSAVLGSNADEQSGEPAGGPEVSSGAGEPAAVAAIADSTIQQSQSDSIAGFPEDSAGALLAEQGVSGTTDTGRAAIAPLDLPQGFGDSLLQTVPQIQPETGISDVAQPETAADSAALLQSLPPGVEISGPIVVIQGLVIESVTEFPAGGHRVVQLLDSGEPLALMSIPIAGDSVDATTAGQITVREVPGDTAVGTVSFGRYNVNVRGRVAVEVLRTLLGRLAVREP